MFSHSETLSFSSRSNVIIWLSLALQAGAINAGGLMACHKFVTHTTGFATFFGTELAQGNLDTAIGVLAVPVFFLAGAMISGFIIDRRIQTNRQPLYFIIWLMMSVLLGIVSFAGAAGSFGEFGKPLNIYSDFSLLAMLCLASGLQNATITSAFGAIVRTTHLTGITTDLGLGLVRILSHSHKVQSRANEIKATWLRFGLIFSFGFGSLLGAFAYLQYDYFGFILPFTI